MMADEAETAGGWQGGRVPRPTPTVERFSSTYLSVRKLRNVLALSGNRRPHGVDADRLRALK